MEMWVALRADSNDPRYTSKSHCLFFYRDAGGEVRRSLPIRCSDTYTITAWWPAAPAAGGWSTQARYEIVQGGQVVISATLDQRRGSNEWHLIATAPLDPAQSPYVRLVCAGAPCVADALHIRSEARYNNGQPAAVVILAPLDGITLERLTWCVYLLLTQLQ